AEDGIRDWSVTGVQTCALPIYSPAEPDRPRAARGLAAGRPRPLRGDGRVRPEQPPRGTAERALGGDGTGSAGGLDAGERRAAAGDRKSVVEGRRVGGGRRAGVE